MEEADEVKVQVVDTNETAPGRKRQKALAARRKFLRQALAVTSGIAVAEILPSALLKAAPPQAACSPGQTLRTINEIKSNGNKLQAVLKVVNGYRSVPTSVVEAKNKSLMLRYYKGYNPADRDHQSWPPDYLPVPAPPGPSGPCGPGPTFRCSIGDYVQITLLNQVNIGKYPSSPIVSGEKGSETGCDEGTSATDPNWYPKTTGDTFPDCLHASSAANIHFHGTHVTPSTTGDNVLVNIWPNKDVVEKDVEASFAKIFDECDTGHIPQSWEDLPLRWRLYQERLIKEYDATAQFRGGVGLPEYLRLWPQVAEAIKRGIWPQYYVGSYPYCFKIPKYEDPHHSVTTGPAPAGTPLPLESAHEGLQMGQAPGTHWYHSHKHGSTAVNMFNGLSGALIIEDNSNTGYDGKLKAFYKNDLEQIVLVFQQIAIAANLLSAAPPGPPAVLVNGQFTPTITMRAGQVQLWRMINACVQKPINIQFASCNTTEPPKFKQTAQDGVQFAFANYSKLDNGKEPINMAPANRVDLLVKAPTTTGLYVLGTTAAPFLFIQVNVTDKPSMDFPVSGGDFPTIPTFLRDITDEEIRLSRKIVYGWEPGRRKPFRNAAGAAPQYTIDGKQFEDGVVNQVMRLDSAEEWTIYNQTSIAHPFHIHVNPFQIVEIYDPNNIDPLKRHLEFDDPPGTGKDFVWWDDFAIPVAKQDKDGVILNPATGRAQDPGYFRMRTRFVDFTGQYVQHCHILAHEDRGMMQLLEVVSNKTVIKHH